jgi:hypothetical protein
MRASQHQIKVPEHFIKLHHPDNDSGGHFLGLPRDAVAATHVPLLHPPIQPPGDPDNVWWQLTKADRRAFRVIHFHAVYVAGDDKALYVTSQQKVHTRNRRKAIVAWLRWIAVRQAKFGDHPVRRRSWQKAYNVASERLKGTVAKGEWVTMKTAYFAVQRLLKAKLV